MKNAILKFDWDFLEGNSIRIINNKKQTSYEKHWHSYYELVFYNNCEGICVLNGEKYNICDRCIFLLTPKDFHEIKTINKPDSESFVISFNETIIDNSLLSFIANGPFFVPEINHTVEVMIQDLYHYSKKNFLHKTQYEHHLFNCILIYVLQRGNQLHSQTKNLNPLVLKSISMMMENPTKEHSLESFSKSLGIDKSYFSHLFHDSTGISFKKYLTMLRMEYAKRLLEENKLQIIEIGYECGYNTTSQFIRAFKSFTGVPPSIYRKKYQEENKL